MAVKNCCVESCYSSSNREEDLGVTYHKFPKDVLLRGTWVKVTRIDSQRHTAQTLFVCSRHFCKSDFQIYKDSKYVLKSDAVPSIFPWKMADTNGNIDNNAETNNGEEANEVSQNEPLNDSKESTESEPINIEVVHQLMNQQEKDEEKETTEEISPVVDKSEEKNNPVIDTIEEKINAVIDKSEENISTVIDTNEEKNPVIDTSEKKNPVIDKSEINNPVIEEAVPETKGSGENDNGDSKNDTSTVASSVMDMILDDSTAKVSKKKQKLLSKANLSPGDKADKANSMSLSVGSKVEAKDFGEYWYPALIVEVDYEEMEVLVRYDNDLKKHDEWISVSSPRLRPVGSKTSPPPPPPPDIPPPEVPVEVVREEPKVEEKPKVGFAVGERCLARWRDNRRFMATVSQDLGDGKYEIIFDDGAVWSCTANRLSKSRESNIDMSVADTSIASPITPGPSALIVPAYNTHLFDPSRDYLSSKSERREMKRKLNIKEIFNIGQKKKKIDTPERKKVVKKKKVKKVKVEEKKEIPDAVASIIGTVSDVKKETKADIKIETDMKMETTDIQGVFKGESDDNLDLANSETLSAPESQDMKHEDDPAEEEMKLEKFEQEPGDKHEEVIDRIKEVIIKLEGGITEIETKTEPTVVMDQIPPQDETKPKKNPSKIKKGKKLRLLQEKKVKKQVEKVKCELEEMKRQVEEMRKQMMMKTEELAARQGTEMPESFLLPGEWCCKWVNGQPVGTVCELESEPKMDGSKLVLPRRSVQVEDKRLPPGWTKHMVRRSFGSSAGKWDVVLISPGNNRFHSKTDMRAYFENHKEENLKPYEHALLDFGVHLKLARRMGWYTNTPGGEPESPVVSLSPGTLCASSPLVKKKSLGIKKNLSLKKSKKRSSKSLKIKLPRLRLDTAGMPVMKAERDHLGIAEALEAATAEFEPPPPPLEDGFVYVGSLKVQVIENLLRCPAEGCLKNFRNNTLLKMHIKHYHRELRKMLGATPKVQDLASARTKPTEMEMRMLKLEAQQRTIKVKLPRLPKKQLEPKVENVESTLPLNIDSPQLEKLPRSLDSPKMRALNKPVKRPKVLLPVRRVEEVETKDEDEQMEVDTTPMALPLDFETAISTHTVTKPLEKRKDKKISYPGLAKMSEDDEWGSMNSDMDTRSSYPRSGTPDSKHMEKLISSDTNEEQKEGNMYTFSETGERIKIVHMKREEIINCHCGFREEDGLMVQCELCLCWQHALCHNIQREADVPEKYTCSICLNPRRGRRSQRFLHDQDRLYEGLLPGAKPCETLRRSHELSGNLLRIEDALHALRVKYYVACKKDHPKLYLWAKDWEMGEINLMQERLNSDYSDLNIMISSIGKENMPLKPEEMKDLPMDIRTPPLEEHDDRYSQREQLGSQSLLSGLLSSPGGASLDLPISTSELEKLAKSVQERECLSPAVPVVPQPEAPIEDGACRERLLRHIARAHALVDARLDSIEAQVAELESQDPSFEDDETAEYFPRTKQTIQMLMRDLDTMEELGVIT